MAGRASELVTAIGNHSRDGGEVLMLTLTMRHRADQGLAELWDALKQGWRAATSGSRSVREPLAGVEWVRRVEATHGSNGWHVHVHALLFIAPGTNPDKLGQVMFAAWRKRLISLGLDAPEPGPGMQIKLLDLSKPSDLVADYLAKGHYEAADEDPRGAALELASSGKQARGNNRTPMEILASFVANGEVHDAELWREWEQGSKGRRALTWSKGARDRLVPDDELSDEELAQETDHGGELVALIDAQAWRLVSRRPVLLNRLLAAVELWDDDEGLIDHLSELAERDGIYGAVFGP